MSHPDRSTADTSQSSVPARLEPDKFEALWRTCTVDDPSRIDAYLSFMPLTVRESATFKYCLSVAISHGPHYATMQHLITHYNAKITGDMLVTAVKMDIPSSKRIELLDVLLHEGDFDINAQVDGWNTLLQSCVKEKEVAAYLLKRGANPNFGPAISIAVGMWGASKLVHNSGSVLAAAVRWGSNEVVELLVQYGAILKNADTVHCAVERGDTSVLETVLALGADVNEAESFALFGRNHAGSPLLRAVKKADVDMVRILLERGGDASFVNYKGESVLGLVVRDDVHPEIKALFLSHRQ